MYSDIDKYPYANIGWDSVPFHFAAGNGDLVRVINIGIRALIAEHEEHLVF